MFNPQLDKLDKYIIERGRYETRPNFSGVQWEEVPMIDLKKGDIFRAFTSSGERVELKNSKIEFLAKSDGYIDEVLKIPAVDIIA
jgi:hypothetical protein